MIMAPTRNPPSTCNSKKSNECGDADRTGAKVTAPARTARRQATLVKQQQHQAKNAELIPQPPTQRDLQQFNDFLLSTVSNITNNNQQQQHQLQRIQQQQQVQEEQRVPSDCLGATSANYDIPIVNRAQQEHQRPQRVQQEENDNKFLHTARSEVVVGATAVSTAQTNIDNTNTNIDQIASAQRQQQQQQTEQQLCQLTQLAQSYIQGAAAPAELKDNSLPKTGASPKVKDISFEHRLELIKSILILNSSNTDHTGPIVAETIQNLLRNMVHEINPAATEDDVVVNSASLEDVALSEISDNRAQSIQSLHSMQETPTPDTSPSYDELQQRLEVSNRNIQSIQEKQAHLLRLQNAAKEHLSEMELVRQNTPQLSFSPRRGQSNGTASENGAPNYETIDQVQNDMANLVGRMRHLTTFIHNTNELGNILGDDGPEILAEQETLQQKLESLRTQRDEMRHLVGELQDINRSAEQTAKAMKAQKNADAATAVNNDDKPQTSSSSLALSRTVPVDYARVVPIAVHTTTDQAAATAALIQKKNADIAAMKAQLSRLKDMVETVNLIEERTKHAPPESLHQSNQFSRECTRVANSETEAALLRKMRMMNEIASDLRAQAQTYDVESERINALKAEIERRKEQAAAAAQMGEDALKRSSLTPTPMRQQLYEEENLKAERDQLKSEYDIKKKQFELLCKQLDGDDSAKASSPNKSRTQRNDTLSEADDEAEDANDSDFSTNKYFAKQHFSREPQGANGKPAERTSQESQTLPEPHERRDTESNLASSVNANSTQDGASLEAASMQSGSSRSFFMPPPMPPVCANNWAGLPPPPIPPTWNTHLLYGIPAPPPPPMPIQANFTPPIFLPHPPVGVAHTAAPAMLPPPPPPAGSDFLQAQSATGPSSNASMAQQLSSGDVVLLQQFVQTQQMVINSICQCNQTLWHQQREIDTIHNMIHTLQERINQLHNNPMTEQIPYSARSESVPPQPITAGMPNNIFVGMNRAQSEQPIQFSSGGSAFTNYQQQQQLQQQQHMFQQRQQRNVGYNYATETHQQHVANASSVYHAALNNATANVAAPPPQPQTVNQPTHFNNEIPLSPTLVGGPGPIFMHHHNNSIHQNNANLRIQNHHANNLQQQQQQQQQQLNNTNSSAPPPTSTLNNQVPPGNRANNYWDNFRSYSRQNLLSTNYNKSNEEHQHQQQQQQQQQHLQHHQQQQQQPQTYQSCQPTSWHRSQSQERPSHQLFPQPPPPPPRNSASASNSNNLNSNNNKYMDTVQQRSRINQQQQQQQQQQQRYQSNMGSNLNRSNAFHQEQHCNSNWLEDAEGGAAGVHDFVPYAELSNGNNDDQSTPYNAVSNVRNMNLNYGNSPLYQRNKVPPKPPTSATLNPSQSDSERLFDGLTFGSSWRDPSSTLIVPTNRRSPAAIPQYSLRRLEFDAPDEYVTCPINSNSVMAENMAESFQRDDDNTAEETNRNLLENALKNDKFTTKFYESIKEDVFRRLESILLEKENRERRQQLQLRPMQFYNDFSRDPRRKLYLNARNNQQKPLLTTTNQSIAIAINEAHMPEEESTNAETESNNGDNETALDVMQQQLATVDVENEKPEEDVHLPEKEQDSVQVTVSSTPLPANWRNNTTTVDNNNATVNQRNLTTKTCGKKSKRRHRHDSTSETSNGAGCSLQDHKQKSTDTEAKSATTATTDTSMSPPPETEILPDYELIDYIIKRIRNQTHANTLINDTLLVEISKLTATAAQNSATAKFAASSASTPNISPKRIYAKIKKLSIPRHRDEFLVWYQSYLESMFLVEQHISHCKESVLKNKRFQKLSNETKAKQTNNRNAQHNINDADLAEADQNSAKNSSHDILNESNDKSREGNHKKHEMEEFENNENPEEEAISGACALAIHDHHDENQDA